MTCDCPLVSGSMSNQSVITLPAPITAPAPASESLSGASLGAYTSPALGPHRTNLSPACDGGGGGGSAGTRLAEVSCWRNAMVIMQACNMANRMASEEVENCILRSR